MRRSFDLAGFASCSENLMTARTSSILGFTLLTAAVVGLSCDDPAGDGDESGSGGEEGSSEPGPWDGQTFRLDVPKNNWTSPPGVGREIGDYVPAFFLKFAETADGEVELLIGSGDPGAEEQNECSGTVTIALESPETPNEFGPVTMEAQLTSTAGGTTMTVTANIYDLTFTDVLPVDGEPAEDGQLTATMDVREIAPLFTLLPEEMRTPENVCMGLEMSFDAPCEPCSYDGGDDEPFCLNMVAMGLGAEEADDVEVTPNPAPSCE